MNKVIKSKTKNGIFEKFESSRYKSVSSLLTNMCNCQSHKKQGNEDMEKLKETNYINQEEIHKNSILLHSSNKSLFKFMHYI